MQIFNFLFAARSQRAWWKLYVCVYVWCVYQPLGINGECTTLNSSTVTTELPQFKSSLHNNTITTQYLLMWKLSTQNQTIFYLTTRTIKPKTCNHRNTVKISHTRHSPECPRAVLCCPTPWYKAPAVGTEGHCLNTSQVTWTVSFTKFMLQINLFYFINKQILNIVANPDKPNNGLF